MRKSKYVIKFRVPNQLGENKIFYTSLEIIAQESITPREILRHIHDHCRSDILKIEGIKIKNTEIDIIFISLLDSCGVKK